MLSYVDHFNFNWMTNYIYADDAAPVLPKGTIIHVTAWHDNTTGTRTIPTRINGWAGAIARWTRWRTPGSTSPTSATRIIRRGWRSTSQRRARAAGPEQLHEAPTHLVGMRWRAPSRRSEQLPLEPPHDSGQSVSAAFEGWFPNPDGTFSILFGYFNRNFKAGTGYSHRSARTALNPAGPIRDSRRTFLTRPAMGRVHHYGPEGFRLEETHVDVDGQWRDELGSGQSRPALAAISFPGR